MECLAHHVFADLVDGVLEGEALRDVEIHIDVCASCRIALSYALRDRPDGDPTDADRSDVGAAPDTPGARLGRYQLFDVLGAGGMGVVYAAHDPELDRRVAIKVLRDDDDAGDGDERLRTEAQTLARISHPNVLTVYDVGRAGGRRFLAMELVDGATLRGYLSERALDWRARLRLLVGVGRGLAAAHAVGVVHRDVKPDNVLIGADGRPRVSDFGLARAALADMAQSPAHGARATSTTAGTPAYLAPELRAGTRATAASDQFAFATMCWEILFGARPGAQPMPPRGPRELRRVIVGLQRALAEAPAARWPSMAVLVEALEAPPRPRVRGLALLALALGGTTVALTAALSGRDQVAIPPVCAALETRAAELWTDANATVAREAFARTSSALASSTAASVDAALRRTSADWGAAASIGCRRDPVAFVHGAGPVECLERRAAQIEALAAIFATADATVVEHAAATVAGLSPAASCLDAHGAPVPPRTELWLALARRVEAGYADFEQGRHDRARLTAEAVMREADAAGILALRAEALLLVAEIERVAGDLDEAQHLLGEAASLADRAGADSPRATALMELARLAASDRLRADEAAQYLLLARGAVARLGDPPAVVAELTQIEANLAMLRQQPSAAIELLLHALGVVLEANLQGLEVWIRNDLATAYVAADRPAEAVTQHEQLLEIVTATRTGYTVAAAHTNLAASLSLVGRLDESMAHAERAVELLGATGETRILAQALGNLSSIQAADGRLDTAMATAEESLHVTERVLGGEHVDVALRSRILGQLQRDGGHLEEAAACFRRAIEIYTAAIGDHGPAIAGVLTEVADLELDIGRPRAALAAAERALRLRANATAAGVESTADWVEDTKRNEEIRARARLAARHKVRQ